MTPETLCGRRLIAQSPHGLAMLVLHASVNMPYGSPGGLPETKVGTFPQTLHDEAKKQGWAIISMKNDWKRIFVFAP